MWYTSWVKFCPSERKPIVCSIDEPLRCSNLHEGDWYVVSYELLSGVLVGFVGMLETNGETECLWTDCRTNCVIATPVEALVVCQPIDGPWLTADEELQMLGDV